MIRQRARNFGDGTHLNPNKISHWRLVPTPVSGGGVALICGPKRGPVFAVKNGLSGLLTDDDLAWTSEGIGEVTSDVPTPAFYDGDFFILSDVRKSLSRVAAGTGEVKWTIPTAGPGEIRGIAPCCRWKDLPG